MGQIDEREENKIILRNSIWSIGFKIVEYVLTFLTTPLLLKCLGVEKYGIYTSALSVVSWIYYFDFGIGSGLRNKLTQSIVKKDYETSKKSITIAYVIVSLVSIIAFSMMLIFSFFVDFDSILNAYLTDENLNMILIIAIFLACVNFVISLSINILYAIQRTALVSGLGIVSKLLMLLVLLLYYKFHISSMLLVVVLEGVAQLVKNIIALLYIKRIDKNLCPNLKEIDFKYAKGILGFGIQIFVMQVSALVLNSTDNIIIMRLYGAVDVTPYNMCHKFFSIINSFFIVATGPLWTAYTTAYTLHDVNYIKKTLKKALLLYSVVFFGLICSVVIFRPFMKIYLGQDLEYQNGLVLFVAAYYALLIFSHNFSAFVHGISKVNLTTIACLISAIINVPFSIIFAKYFSMGLNGIILGSIISLVVTTTAYVYTTISEIKKLEVKE